MRPSVARSSGSRSVANSFGPGRSSIGMPALRSLVSSEAAPSAPISSSVKPNDLGVAAVPARRHEHGGRPRDHLAQHLRHGRLAARVLAAEVGEQLDAEADVALLVERDVHHPGAEAGQQVAVLEVAGDEVLAGLGERRLDDHVVERHRGGETRQRGVLLELDGHAVEPVEDLHEAPRQLRLDRRQPGAVAVAGDADDLGHEAAEEDGVARLVDLLGGEEVLLLLARRGVDVGREAVGDGVLAPEEEGVVPEGGLALEVRELLAPLSGVLAEVDLHRAPVALLPARVEVVVGDRVCRESALAVHSYQT